MIKIFTVLLLAALCLTACGSTPPTPPETTVAPATTAPQPAEIVLNAADACYTIVRPDRCDEATVTLAADFCMELRELAGETKLKIETDWVKDEADTANENPEILIGLTNRPESSAAQGALSAYLDFVIAVEGNKICINAHTPERLADAVAYFRDQIRVEDGTLVYSQTATYLGHYDAYPLPTVAIAGAPVADFVLVLPQQATAQEQKLADDLQTYIKQNHGPILDIVTDAAPPTAHEILIGRTNRPESGATVDAETARYMTVGEKLVLLAGSPSHYAVLKRELLSALETGQGSLAAELDVPITLSGLDYFITQNYAADLIATIDEDLNLGVQALLSCCEYYGDSMVADSARGNKWIYSSNAKYVTQVCRFDDMLYKFTAKGGNCAAPVNWAFIDMELMPDTYRFWGDSDGSFARREKVEPYVGAACEIYDLAAEGKTFMQLYNEGRIKTGDIFLGRGHTWIYRGAQSFYAAGHDAKWHSDPSVNSEDKRKAVFEDWILTFDECRTNRNYGVTYQIRIKDDYVPRYFRNTSGELVENPIAAK